MRLRALLVGFIVFGAGMALPGVAQAAPPTNDDFPGAGATLSGPTAQLTGTNVEATGQFGEPDHAGASKVAGCDTSGPNNNECQNSVWYKFTTSQAGDYTVDLCMSNPGGVDSNTRGAATDFKTVLAVYTATGNTISTINQTPLASNRNTFDSAHCSNPYASKVKVTLAAAPTAYYIAVAGRNGSADNEGAIHGVIEPCNTPGANCGTAPGPTASTGGVTPSGLTVVLDGIVNPKGQNRNFYFEWDTHSCSQASPCTHRSPFPQGSVGAADDAPHTVHSDSIPGESDAPIQNLTAGTTYYYQLVVLDGSTAINGGIKSFVAKATPTVTTISPTGLGDTKATLRGTINPNGSPSTYHFEYWPSDAPASISKTPIPDASATGTSSIDLAVNVTGLTKGGSYVYQLVAKNANGTSTSNQTPLTTPKATTGAATLNDATSNVDVEGHFDASVPSAGVSFRFDYSTDPATFPQSQTVPGTPPGGTSTSNVTGHIPTAPLDSGVTYYFRFVAFNNTGNVAVGDNGTFKLPGAPVVRTLDNTRMVNVIDPEFGPTVTTTINALVNPNGGTNTVYRFNWGTTSAYGFNTPYRNAPNGVLDQLVTYELTELDPGTVYHFRVEAKNDPGGSTTTKGGDHAFVAGSGPIYSDFNADSKRDIVWHNRSTGASEVWLMNGNHFASKSAINKTAATQWLKIGAADFNDDGKPDILVWNSATGVPAVWLMNGASYVSSALFTGATAPGRTWVPRALGDLNSDGSPDIVWHNTRTGKVSIWYLQGTTLLSARSLNITPSTAWRPSATGDFDGDGNTDVVVRNISTGRIRAWLLIGNGATAQYVGGQTIAQLSTNWTVAGSGEFDFDGNGITDLLFRNTATQSTSVWYMGRQGGQIVRLSAASLDGAAFPPKEWYPL